MLRAAKALGESEAVRVEPTLLALHALPPEFKDRREEFVRLAVESHAAGRGRRRGWRARSTPFAKAIGFTPDEVRDAVRGGRASTACGSSSMPSSSAICDGAALAAEYGALSADHLEHADEAGVAAMARAGMVAVLLPGAFYALQGDARSRRSTCCAATACRWRSRPTAIRAPRRCCRRP